MVVSMRPYKKEDIERIVQITSRYPACHGGPIHIGQPSKIGLTDKKGDLVQPFVGDEPRMEPEDIPVFWACGVSAMVVLRNAKVEYAITHAPHQVGLVTDLLIEEIEFRSS